MYTLYIASVLCVVNTVWCILCLTLDPVVVVHLVCQTSCHITRFCAFMYSPRHSLMHSLRMH